MKNKSSRWIITILLAIVITPMLSYSTSSELTEQTEDEVDENIEEEIVELYSVIREDGYNSIQIEYFNFLTHTELGMIPTLYCVYNNTDAYYTIEEALEAEVIKEYKEVNNYQQFLLKNGYKFNM